MICQVAHTGTLNTVKISDKAVASIETPQRKLRSFFCLDFVRLANAEVCANVSIPPMHNDDSRRKFLCSISDGGEYLFYQLTASEIEQANFLDVRSLKLENAVPECISVHDYHAADQAWPLRYIFHTAFCGSTLLSRALQETPKIMVLKEPDVLMKISGQSLLAGNRNIVPFLLASLKELSKPWTPSGSVVIKPTNSVNRMIPEILGNYPGRAVLLCSALEDFLISCFKKLPSAEQKIRWMAQHLIHKTDLQNHLGVETDHPFEFAESCVLVWYSQMEYFAKAIKMDIHGDISMLDRKAMVERPFDAIHATVDFLGLDKTDAEIEASISREFNRNSKKLDKIYTEAERLAEATHVREKYSTLLDTALEWAETNVAPIAMVPQNYKTLI